MDILVDGYARKWALLRAGWLALLVAGGLACSGPGPDGPGNRRNVLLITLDTTRADRLGCYGYGPETTPHLDALADEGVVFDLAIAQAAVTPVSHASILTGLNPYNHGLRVLHGVSGSRLPEERVSLAETLRDAGYATGAFLSAFPVSAYFGLEQGFDVFDAEFGKNDAPPINQRGVVNTGSAQRRAEDTNARALEWLGRVDGPFLAWLHYFDPHDAALLPPEETMASFSAPPGSEKDRLRALYDFEIRYMDAQIGAVFQALRRSRHWENTIVVVVADHGEGLGDHDWWSHGVLYQEQIRVPFLLRSPGLPASRVDSLVRTIDIVPTLLALLEMPPDNSLDGLNLLPLIGGDTASGPRWAYSDSINRLVYHPVPGVEDRKTDVLAALTDGRWKYIHHSIRREESELYDLANDPRETRNRFTDHPDIAKRFQAELKRRAYLPEGLLGEQRVGPRVVEQLRALGYLAE